MTNENDDDYKVFNMTITASTSLLTRLGNVLKCLIYDVEYCLNHLPHAASRSNNKVSSSAIQTDDRFYTY